MYQSIWRCRVDDRGCYPVARVREEHPVSSTEPPPLCSDHEEPMVLVSWRAPERVTKRRTRGVKRPGGFKAEQLRLF